MLLDPGTRLGPYEILSAIGAGGMGAVFQARDTRLQRTVAIKILHADSTDPSARDRFLREARAISALSHPHICTLYDVGSHDARDFLVMEYVEGDTLAARLARGPLPIDQTLTFAMQMASALDRAHSAGIVHRDIKPANVMLTGSGVKLLDFGLAKPAAPIVAPDGRTQDVSPLTMPGVIVGTIQYMAPEQLEGRAVDARTDLFAFGALLYEMVSGRKAFDADTPAGVIAAILEREPARLSAVQPATPAALESIVAACLEKEPDARWQTARDLSRALELSRQLEGPRRDAAAGVSRRRPWPAALTLGGAAAGALLTLAIGATFGSNQSKDAVAPSLDVRFSIEPEHGSAFVTAPASVVAPQFALSPDGAQLAFVATSGGRPMLWVRPLGALQARALAGTEDATSPFWAPDDNAIGFFSEGKIKTVRLAGGAPLVRVDASRDPRGASWAADGTILATLVSQGGIMSASSKGAVEPVVPVNRSLGDSNHRWPMWLVDGRHFLYLTRGNDKSRRGIYLAARDSPPTRLVDSDHGAAVADGRLLFVRGRALVAQPFDLPNRRLTDDAVVILDEIGLDSTGYAAFSVSQTGRLAYARTWPADGELTWFARDGKQMGQPIAPLADYVSFNLSSDGTRVAVGLVDPQTATPDIWVLDLIRGSRERLTFDPGVDANAFWSPDGSRILFRSNRTGRDRLYIKQVNASASEEPFELTMNDQDVGSSIVTDYSRDASHVLLSVFGSATSFDVWRADAANRGEASPVVRTTFDEHHAVLSPDSRWLAYVSNETGAPQVYVQSFPDGGRRWQVSSRGGSEPQWRGDGRELFYLAADQTLTAVGIDVSSGFKSGLPAPLFRVRVPVAGNPYRQQFAVSRDGQRFLVNTAPASSPPPAIHIVLDWRVLLKRGTP